MSASTVEELGRILEVAGIEFIENGVRLRPVRPDAEERYRAIRAIVERSVAGKTFDPDFTEDDLYDENGLPA